MNSATHLAFWMLYAVVVWCNRAWLGDQFRRWFG